MKAKKPYEKKKRRVGRGAGSGSGKTSGKGHKGQLSRSGNGKGKRPGFEGGQLPLYRRLPKRGFNNTRFGKEMVIINLDQISDKGIKELDPEIAIKTKLVSKLKDGIKILGTGELKSAVEIKAHAFSSTAKEKIEKAGGKALLIQTTQVE